MAFAGYPESITVDGINYKINFDFRLMVSLEKASENRDGKKILDVLSRFFLGNIPKDTVKAVNALTAFYLCGEKNENHSSASSKSKKCYDFDIDEKLFIAAFMQQYGIDLTVCKLHWWTFTALFAGLTDSCELVKVMQIRNTDIKQITNKKERERIRRLQEKYKLNTSHVPKFKTAEEHDKAMIAAAQKRLKEIEEGEEK